MDLGVRGRAFLVAGGSRGLGLAVARLLASEGAKLALVGRDATALRAAAESVESSEVLTITADLSTPGAGTEVVARARTRFGALDGAVLSVSADSPVADDPELDGILARVDGKAIPALRCASAAIEAMRSSGSGSVVFVGGVSASSAMTSFGGFTGLRRSAMPQALSNSLIAAYSKYLSDEVGPSGIRVNVVSPGLMDSERGVARLAEYAEAEGIALGDARARLAGSHPLGGPVTVDEVASVVAFLLSDLASGVTGQSISVDRGFGRAVSY